MAIREQELGANATLIPPMRSNGKVFRLTFDEGRKPLRHIEYTHDEDLVGPSGAFERNSQTKFSTNCGCWLACS
jgi:hypothetical protein